MTARIVLASLLLSAPTAVRADDHPDLPPGKKLTAELAGKYEARVGDGNNVIAAGYLAEYSLTLKAGAKITINGEVVGKGRTMRLLLADPTGKYIAATPARGRADTGDAGGTKLTVPEVAASGRYTILVVSEQIGEFTLKADYPTPKVSELKAEVRTEKAIREDIARLEKELERKKAELDALLKK